jgi:type IV pilus assembly protein PilF
MNKLTLAALAACLLLAGCETTTTGSQFQNDKTSMKDASEDNVKMAYVYLSQGERSTAMQKVQKAIELDPDNADAYTAEGAIYDVIGDFNQAGDAYRKAIRKAPDNPDVENNYAVFLCKHGKAKDSESYFIKAAMNPLYTTPDQAYSNAGVCARQIPDLAAAELYFRKALEVNPAEAQALFQLAQLNYDARKYLESRAFLQRYGDAGLPPRPEVLYLGMQTELALHDQQGATDYAKKLVKLFPTSPQAQQLTEASGHGGNPG